MAGNRRRSSHGLAMQTASCNPKGCLSVIGTMACGAEAESIKDAVIARRASSEAAMVARFERAEAEGDLPEGMTAAALVRFLLALMQGLSVQAGAGASCAQLEQLVETSMSVWPTR